MGASKSGAGTECPISWLISAKIAGVTPDKVTLHVMKTGGGFGRRAVADGDVVSEAVAVSKALGGKPVRVQWTREDDMRGGRYRPAYVHRLKAGLDAQGMSSLGTTTLLANRFSQPRPSRKA